MQSSDKEGVVIIVGDENGKKAVVRNLLQEFEGTKTQERRTITQKGCIASGRQRSARRMNFREDGGAGSRV